MTNIFLIDFILFIFINILIFYSWFSFLAKKKISKDLLDLILYTFIICINQIVYTSIFLALIKKLSPLYLYILNLAISFIIFLNIDKEKNFLFIINKIKEVFNFDKIFSWIKNLNFISKVCLFLLLFSIFYIIFLIIIFPPHDWDGLYYHLGFVGYLIQERGFPLFDTGSLWIDAYPKNIELLNLWSAIFLKNGIIIESVQLIFLIFCLFSFFNLFKRFNFKNNFFLGLFLFLSTPVVFSQSTTTYVDLAQGCLFFILLSLLIKIDLSRNFKDNFLNILIIGMGLGFLMGIKFFSVIFVFLLLFYFFSLNPSKNLKLTMIFLLFALIFGSFWYLRNFLIYKNPLYPFKINFSFINFSGEMGIEEFVDKAYKENNWKKIAEGGLLKKIFISWTEQFGWTRGNILYTYDNPFAGLGPNWFIFFFPSIIFSAIFSFLEKNKEFFKLVLITSAGFFIVPQNWQPRYSLYIIGIGILSFLYMLNILAEKRSLKNFLITLVFFISVLTLFFSSSMGYFHPDQIIAYLKRNPIKNNDIYFRGGEFYSCLNQLTFPNTLIVYDSLTDFIYPYWNYNFSNRVRYLSNKEKSFWTENIFRLKPNYIVTKKTSEVFNWINNDLEIKNYFELKCKDETRGLYLYSFLKNQ